MKLTYGILALFFVPYISMAQLSTRTSWEQLSATQKQSVFRFAEEYKAFLTNAKTELTTVREVVALAEKNGYKRLTDNASWRAGARYYDVNRDRTVCLIVVGKKKLDEGVRIIGGHIDSPRLELKGRPLYDRHGFVLFQTMYHGGIKKYQWVNVPLALMGRVDKTDGTTTWVEVGNRPGEPVFIISDLAPHVDRPYRSRTAPQVIRGEELDPIVGTIPAEDHDLVQQVETYLKTTYQMVPADFISAELALVPALAPRDVGFDKSLVAAYGQDDRLCSYVAARASMAVSHPTYTTVAFLVDNEETGSNNNTGANSDYLRALLGRLLHLQSPAEASEYDLRRVLRSTRALSADVTTGINPLFPDVQEAGNSARLGYGVVIKLYGRGNSPNSEFTARFRKLLEEAHIPYQTHTYKVDIGGGGTIGNFLSRENMEVLDCGVPLLSMHSPYSLSSKVDLWWLYQSFQAFFR